MVRSYDEPFTLYGLLAQTVETDAARSYVTFTLNPAARFSDGKPVTAEDVVFSWQLLRDKGRPNHRIYYSKVAKAEIVGERTVRFDLAGADDRELPLILGLMPVLAKHAINPDTFEETSMTPPIGSGPYRGRPRRSRQEHHARRAIRTIGAAISRVNRGFWNFDEIRFDYYRDANSYHEAFKKGLFDLRKEDDPGRWQTGLRFPGAARRPRRQGELHLRPAEAELRLRVQHAARGLCRHPRARGDRAAVRLRMGEPLDLLRPLPAQRRATSRAPNFPRAAGRRTRASAPCSRRFPTRCAPTCSTAPGRRRSTDGSGRDRAILRRALALLARGRLRAARHRADRTRAAAGRSASRSWSAQPRRGTARAAVRRASSSAPASRRRCAWSMRCNTRRGESPSIST